jgi:hypothetical protein
MSKESTMWAHTKEPPSDIETLLNDTINSQELEVSQFHNIFSRFPFFIEQGK